MKFSLHNLDRRIIFLCVFLGVAIPLLLPFSLPVNITPPVEAVYHQVERIAAEKGTVLLSFDYGPGSEAELQPMARAVLRHCFSRQIKVVAICLWPDAPGLAQEVLQATAAESGMRYGVDYAYMGYKPGGASVVLNMGQEFRNAFAQDARGVSADSLAVLRGIHSLRDFGLVFDLAAGSTIDQVWIPYGQEKYRFVLAAGCTAVMAPDLFPFLQSGQMAGLIAGLAGAAEYEKLVGRLDSATAGMQAQSITHLVIIAFIVLGNILYFLARRQGQRGGQ
ncbi:MAG: hypothetical protein EXS58_01570 [Candidatus Latescibacteria bacterium]|nr:hypothetical protein [Candidatus Latescibacterota bacterium]